MVENKHQMKSFYLDKKVVVTGGTGLIGIPLVKKLISYGAKVTVASLDNELRMPKGAIFKKIDLRYLDKCEELCDGQNIIFHLAGVKGSPFLTKTKPASFMTPTVMFSFNMLEAARRSKVERFLFTSSVGVYAPSEVFLEDDVWKTFPSENDTYAGWSKRLCELQISSFGIEYDWKNIAIVRPTNIYGPFDNFDPETAMVIPSLINRVVSGENPLNVWGDGSAIRDFAFSEDVADAMLKVISNEIYKPINLGSGTGFTIKDIVNSIISYFDKKIEVQWDISKPTGDAKRVMDITKAKSLGIELNTSLQEGINKTIDWYLSNQKNSSINDRYNSFKEF